jgi:hypothetical protein
MCMFIREPFVLAKTFFVQFQPIWCELINVILFKTGNALIYLQKNPSNSWHNPFINFYILFNEKGHIHR